ncbi:hypothetical protein A8938_1154 [Algoriphagus zhangzhouensis]|uniref:Uncharacterized protein n=1 Tax=Algoriphagus zhangzhouensis TaxID=1073327 RepID=A0A1M7Z7R9_9BACT|nr:hypothetical protein A8938_1154 [Algoriphagus zhangzhouensis]SHO60977.1 hypothetical protein SAMN04488108_1154 [Algoriphagus zhangzhouensis]
MPWNSIPSFLSATILIFLFFISHGVIFLLIKSKTGNSKLHLITIHEIVSYSIFLLMGLGIAWTELLSWGQIGHSNFFIPMITFNSAFYIWGLYKYSFPLSVKLHHSFYIVLSLLFSYFKWDYYLMLFPLLMGLMESVILVDGLSILLRENKKWNLTLYLFSLSYKGMILASCLLISMLTLWKSNEYPPLMVSLLLIGNSIHFYFWLESISKSKKRINSILKTKADLSQTMMVN